MKINKQELENLLIKNWSSIINPREIKAFLDTKNNDKVSKFSISRFEWTNNYFIVWIEYYTNNNKENKVCELKLYSDKIEVLNDC